MMLSREEILKVYNILDREIDFIGKVKNIKSERRDRVLSNWQFVREKFKEILIDCAKAEGLVGKGVKY